MEDKKSFTSVHEALNNAAFVDRVPPGEPVSFRIDPEVKERALALCYRHGTTLSEFLRQCVYGLLSDYNDSSRG